MLEVAKPPKHPAKYTDVLLPCIFEEVKHCEKVLDPFAGTGKLAEIRKFGFVGTIYANDLERDWLEPNVHGCDYLTYEDAETLSYPYGYFDAIATSPTYGNRMADHHNCKDGSKRITYTHCLGKPLQPGNTGSMHFGKQYCEKHTNIYYHLYDLLKPGGVMVINVSNFIRKGSEVDVCEWTKNALIDIGFQFKKEYEIHTPRMGFGANAKARVQYEKIFVFSKPAGRV